MTDAAPVTITRIPPAGACGLMVIRCDVIETLCARHPELRTAHTGPARFAGTLADLAELSAAPA